MKIALSSDMYSPLVKQLQEELKKRGYTFIYYGPQREGEEEDWTTVTENAIQDLAYKKVDEAIVLCWTGTGCTILANKFPGVRAALCIDGETAQGARTYNHANVLGLSLRLTTEKTLPEILDRWFQTPYSDDPWNLSQIKALENLER